MKIRQAKKILDGHQWRQPNERIARAFRCIKQRTRRLQKKRARSRKAFLAHHGPIKIWADDQFIGYAKSITINPVATSDPSYIEWTYQALSEMAINIGVPIEDVDAAIGKFPPTKKAQGRNPEPYPEPR